MSRSERPKYSRNKFLREAKQKRQDEAAVRQAAAEARTPAQQIARLDAKGYVATKERAKLAAKTVSPKTEVPNAATVEAINEARRSKRKTKKGKAA